MLLNVTGLSKRFAGVQAIAGLDFQLEEGELRGLIGPNGSGKSTFLNLLSGIYRPDAGSIWFEEENITAAEPHKNAARGIARTFQLLRMFSEMTVLENVLVGRHLHVPYGPLAAGLGLRRVSAEEKRLEEEMMELLDFIGLRDRAGAAASELSVGERRLLALGRALAMRPKLLILDEPAAGLSPLNLDNFMDILRASKERYALSIIVVEHILKVVMETCDRVTVLDHGEKIAEGAPDDIKEDPAVIEAYLGREMDDDEVKRVIMS